MNMIVYIDICHKTKNRTSASIACSCVHKFDDFCEPSQISIIG